MVTKVININVLTNKFEHCLFELNSFYESYITLGVFLRWNKKKI